MINNYYADIEFPKNDDDKEHNYINEKWCWIQIIVNGKN